jgi:hypothetical protein
MRLSELFSQLNAAGDIGSFALYLAGPDQDGVDVDLAAVSHVEVDPEKGVARFYPATTARDVDSDDPNPEPFVDMVLEELPQDAAGENDLRLLIEVPLLRDEAGNDPVSLVDVAGVHIGRSSEEVWLLVRPAADFAAGLLPT